MSVNTDLLSPAIPALSAAFGVWILGAVASLFSGIKADHRIYSAVLLTGSTLVLASLLIASGTSFSVVVLSPINFGLSPLATHLDPLSALFLGILGVGGFAVAVFSPGYLKHFRDQIHPGIYWSCLFTFMTAMAMVIISSNAISFLVFWEVMALSSVALVASHTARQRAQRAALIYLGATTVSGVLLTGAFLWYHDIFKSWDFASWHHSDRALVPSIILFFAIAVKAGVWPFHLWMPYAQGEAPSPVSALMSGVMKKVAVYAFIRLLLMTAGDDTIIGYLALGLGTVSTVWGVLFGLIQRDLKRLLAYSTVENMGLIFIAIGLVFLTRYNGPSIVASFALAGALLTAINHSVFKTLLFLGAGSIDVAARTHDLSVLGGLGKRMPFTMACFLIGALSICALPPLNGFANKWMIYQSLFQLSFLDGQVIHRAGALVVIGILSFVGALSLAAYTKAVGICFLGKPRSDAALVAFETEQGMVAAQIFLAGACVVLGLKAPYVLSGLDAVRQEVIGATVSARILFPIPLWKIAVLGLMVIGAVYATLFKRTSPVNRFVTWDCGYGDLPARAEETGTSFSEPIARIFGPLLQYRITTEIKGKDRRHFPEIIKFEMITSSLLEQRVYGPAIEAFQWLSGALAKLQTGSIHLYLLYVFLTLLLLVSVGTRL